MARDNAGGLLRCFRKGADQMLSIVRGLEVTTIDQVHQSLFNPDLVREALAGDPDGEVAKPPRSSTWKRSSTAARRRPSRSHRILREASPPSDLVTLQARITDRGKGIGRIEWRVNGITAAVAAKPAGSGPDYTLTQQLALDPGDNTIEVVAYNASNLLASLPARTTIKFTGAADQAKPKLHILAIGINAYVDRGWTPPGSDGHSSSRRSARGEGCHDLGADISGPPAGSTPTCASPRRWTSRRHATTSTRSSISSPPRSTRATPSSVRGRARQVGQRPLLSDPAGLRWRHQSRALAQRAIDQDRLQDWLANRIKAKKAIILLDTCESGRAGRRLHALAHRCAGLEAAIGRLHEATGRPVLTAAADGMPGLRGLRRHGVFTWALLDALQKWRPQRQRHHRAVRARRPRAGSGAED